MHEGVGIKNPLFFIGIVENNVDPRREGRCQVRAFGVHGTNQDITTEDLPWAIVVQGDYNPNNVPRLNSWIFGVFLDGRDAQQPMILGLIPTQHLEPISPEDRGFGRIPPRDGEVLAQGSRPEDIGQPRNSRLARGEYVEETYVLAQEMNRRRNNRVGGSEDESWEEPSSAYNAQYPYNRVIETAAHTIELDDTPGAERIMVHHKSGSFVQIDTRGTTTHKSVSDKYEINDRRQHVYVGAGSYVTIQGNSHVYVKGNKTEEIMGDYQQIIHGNAIYSVGGQMTMQGSEQMQLRAGDLKMEANVGTMVIRAAKEAQILSGQGAFIKTPKLWAEVTDAHIKTENLNMESTGAMNILGEELYITGTSDANLYGTAKLQVGSGGLLSVYGPNVAIDDYVSMANGEAEAAAASDPAATTAEGGLVEGEVVAPEPPAKNTSIEPADPPAAVGSSGYSSRDHSGVDGATGGGNGGSSGGNTGRNSGANIGSVSAATQSAVTPLLDFIGNIESDGYDDIVWAVNTADYPSRPITQLTIGELLDWMDSIDHRADSEASGRYQIIEPTLRGYNTGEQGQINRRTGEAWPWSPPPGWSESQALYSRAGLTKSDLFNPINQDKLAITLMEEQGLEAFMRGELTVNQFGNRLANVWASLPVLTGENTGQSVYEGDGLNTSLTSPDAFRAVLTRVQQTRPSEERPAGPGGNGGV